MIQRPHRLIVAIDIAGQGADLDAILDAIEAADDAVIGAADLLTLEMQHEPSTIALNVRIPSCHDPAELHRQRDPHCSCADCQQHWIDTTAEALTQDAIAQAVADLDADDGTSGQDRESYTDTQDRQNYRPR